MTFDRTLFIILSRFNLFTSELCIDNLTRAAKMSSKVKYEIKEF